MALGKRLISTGGAAACLTETTDIFGDSSGVALYSLDYDASDAGGLYDGTPTNVDFGVGGQINYGARFNGSSSRIVTGVTPATGSGQFSVSGWVNVDSLSVISGVFSTITNSGTDRKGFSVHILTSGIVRVLVYDSAGSDIIESTDLITVGNWHHIAITYNNGLTKLYVDGNVQTDTVNQLITGYHDSINIGRYFASVTSNTMLGKIDQVRIFSKALDSNEVDTLFAEEACVYTSTTDIVNYPTGTTPIAYYKMDNSSEDYSTGGNDGTDTDVEYRFGRFGQAAVFNGSSSRIENIDTTPLSTATSFSVSAWIKTTSTSRNFIYGDTKYINNTILGIDNNRIEARSVSSTSVFSSTLTISDGNWHNIVMTVVSGGAFKVYFDNSEVINTTVGSFSSASGYQTIGVYRSLTPTYIAFFNGSIDQVRIYDAALTSDQVTELYNEKPEVDTSNFKTVLYEGNGSTQYISNVGFQPDLVWIKNRTSNTSHKIFDSIREATNFIESDTYDAEGSNASTLQSFDANGFTQGGAQPTGENGSDIVAWCWKGGGDDVLNEEGSIDSQVSANTDAGFSIVEVDYGTDSTETVGHGLNLAPEFIITKRTSTTSTWSCYHKYIDTSAPEDYHILLDDDAARTSSTGRWNNTAPTDSVFTTGTLYDQNETVIFYCFHSVSGYSKIGSYEGLGTSTVTVSGLGFKPSWIIVKNADATANWNIYDSRRSGNDSGWSAMDTMNDILYPNLDIAEVEGGSTHVFTANSDGFVVGASNHLQNNKAGDTFIYMAFK